MDKQSKTEKISVTLPKEIIGEIREITPEGKVSSFVAEALAYYLRRRKQKIALEKGFGSWTDKNHPDLQTPEDSVNYVNRLRNNFRVASEELKVHDK